MTSREGWIKCSERMPEVDGGIFAGMVVTYQLTCFSLGVGKQIGC